MTPSPRPDARFRTSSQCSNGNCVEVAPLTDGGAALRDTKDRSRGPLVFDAGQWADFVAGVKNGEFDLS